jgi:hypothetical protein
METNVFTKFDGEIQELICCSKTFLSGVVSSVSKDNSILDEIDPHEFGILTICLMNK